MIARPKAEPSCRYNGVPVGEADEVFVFPTTVRQQGFWYLDQLRPGNPAYNIAVRFRLQGRLRVQVLERALNEIVRRHEALRTTVALAEGVPVQVITPRLYILLERDDLREGSDQDRRQRAEIATADEAHRPFDLTTGPLIRARLLRLEDEEHILLVTVHHIVADGWSIGVLTDELGTLYGAYSRGQASPLPELPLQYADFAVWQKQWLETIRLEEQLEYWTRQLSSLPSLEIPTDRPRPPTQAFAGAIESLLLPAELTAGLAVLSNQEKATPFVILLAAFQVLLQRYSGQNDVFVGSVLAGRARVELEPLIGLFVNPLVFRTDLAGDPPVIELLARVRESVVGAFANQNIPFEHVVDAIQPKRDPSRHPVFQINFLYQRDFVQPFHAEGLTLTAIPSLSPGSIFDLNFFLVERAEGLRASCEYNPDLYESDTIRRLLTHFQTLLEGIIADPKRRISELPMLTAAERKQLLVEWNATRTEYPRFQTIHALFEEWAAATPDAVAVVFGDRGLTYAQLNARANRLAHHLRHLGVGPGTPVGLCLNRSPELIVALLGILKSGGAYVPLDPYYPGERLAFILQDTRAPLTLVDETTRSRLKPELDRLGALCVDVDDAAAAVCDANKPPRRSSADDLAYVMYTSGSTGRPKGVMVNHRAVVRLVRNTDYCRFGPEEVFLHLAPLSFDASTFEIWGPLLNGGRLALLAPGLPTLDVLGAAIRQYGVTTIFLTTALFNLAVEQGVEELKRLRQLLWGGELVSPRHVQKAIAHLQDGQRLLHVYGPTECTTFACYFPVRKGYSTENGIPIGRPIANTTVFVLDEKWQPVPAGIPGELYLGGDGLAQGYLNDPELTRMKFIPDPFSEASGERLYRTGDRARFRADGNLEFLGRLDSQVKILGHRVEPGEIEAALARQPQVRESVVVAREFAPGDRRLVAYVTKRNGEVLDTAALRTRLKATLPDYMLPSIIEVLDALPLTPNGKVDRSALPAPARTAGTAPLAYVAPRDEMEALLSRIWEQVLGVRSISVKADFFDAGGNSLLSMSLLARIEKEIGRKLSLATFFQLPTIEALAACLREEKWENPESAVFPMQRGGDGLPLFLVDAGPFYRPLVRRLGSERPVFGVALPSLSSLPKRFTVKDIATSLVDALGASQVGGPYCLAGWSLAGLIAYEMAQQLRARGEEVALLTLFDTNNPDYLRRFKKWRYLPIRLYFFMQKWLYYLLKVRGMPLRVAWRHVRERTQRFQLKSTGRRRMQEEPSAGEGLDLQPLTLSWEVQYRAAADYEPEPCDVPMVLFRSQVLQTGRFRDPQLGWGDVAQGGLQVYEMPGEHDAMFLEPDVQRLALTVNECLARASTALPSGETDLVT
jgi:amino acid adenylation domain-containing protein